MDAQAHPASVVRGGGGSAIKYTFIEIVTLMKSCRGFLFSFQLTEENSLQLLLPCKIRSHQPPSIEASRQQLLVVGRTKSS